MYVQRTLQIATVLAAFTTFAACSSYGHERRDQPDPNSVAVAVQWDSGPLDQDYHRQRVEMDTRHTQEIASPRADESSDQRTQRHATENKDLERRYSDGKSSHAKNLPPAGR
ncbi:MAG TPA: hypothetical protein VNW46_03145 [Gemmatimonadaceae bacterium]|jgi:hypothetical protein|nr:hypothetical protein [Gemmatimonadaceae bacterium]